MRVLTDPPTEFQNAYEIEPFEIDRESTSWISHNPALGELFGNFIVIDDSILSVYATKNGEFTVTEYLRQVNEHSYRNRGALMKGNDRISSWAVELEKARGDGF